VPWRGPTYKGELPSLGWALLDFYETYLKVPSGAAYGKPLHLTDEQAGGIVRWYWLDPKTGRFVFRRGAFRRCKGWGKSPLLAAWAIGELVGPVLFDGWDANGEPVAKPQLTPWVQIAACSEDQTANTYSALYSMLADSPALEDFGVDLGRTKVFLTGKPGCVIEPVTASAGSREGQPLTAACLDETHLWLRSNGGQRLAATIRRNLGKMNGRSLESTNAFVPGEGSVAEETHKAWEKGEPGLLYDAVEAPWVEDLSNKRALRKALKIAYGDAKWVDLTRVIAEIQDPSTEPADARRFYLNQLVKHELAAVDPHRWASLARPEVVVAPGSRIGVGFDGSISDDATALIGCTAEGHRFRIAMWERPLGARDWRVPRLEVEAKVAETFERYDVGRMLCDPAKWWTEIESWMDRYNAGRTAEDSIVLIFDTNSLSRMSAACDRYLTALAEGSTTHDGDPDVGRHAMAMAKKKVRVNAPDDDGRTRYVFMKMDTRKIDAGIADVLALEAAMTMPVICESEPFMVVT
jgi:hypothetical protein